MIGPWKRAVEAETRADILTGQLVEAHDTIRALSSMIGEMKREGFMQTPPMTPLVDTELGLPDDVMAAIDERATNRQARERLMQFARGALRNSETSEVAERIMQGEGGRFQW